MTTPTEGLAGYTIQSVLHEQAVRQPDAPAIWCEDRRTTFRELDERSNQIARALRAEGLVPGDRVAFMGKNSEFYLEMLYGCAKARLIMMSINYRLAEPEVRFILQDSGSRLFVTDVAMSGLAHESARGTDAQRILV
ncbi:MAG: AMP-binding protein, partial [Actinomycetota bacterium]|nr:AMP-binding protein [Actinomycetota bacterium]